MINHHVSRVSRIYLDHNATMPLRPEIAAVLGELAPYGNPASVHEEGRQARALLEEARERVAAWAGVDPGGVIFTSGGTEANALAVHALARRAESDGRPRVAWMESGSHPSIRANVEGMLASWEIVRETACPPFSLLGECRTAGAACACASAPASLRFVMAAHNETGEISDLDLAVSRARDEGGLLHVDAVQWPGKMAFHPALRDCDCFSVCGHKLGAPTGAGALIFPQPFEVDALLKGGGQENGRRAGTPSLASIVGLGVALSLSFDREHCRRLAVRLRNHLTQALGDGMREISRCDVGLPGTLLVAFPGLPGDVVAAACDVAGVAASYGAACSSGTPQPSAALIACGVDYSTACCAVRFSVGPMNTEAEIDAAAQRVVTAVACVKSSLGVTIGNDVARDGVARHGIVDNGNVGVR